MTSMPLVSAASHTETNVAPDSQQGTGLSHFPSSKFSGALESLLDPSVGVCDFAEFGVNSDPSLNHLQICR